MTNRAAVNWLINLMSDIGKSQHGDLWHYEQALAEIKELLEAEPHWIPCSERLPDHPENNDYYLVTIQCEHYDGWDDYVTGFAEWTERGWDELSCYIGQIKVVAWMPLPEPWKEGE